MLNGHNRRLFEFFDDLQRRIGIVDVVVGQLFAVQLLGSRQRILRSERLAVERRLLMRVLP